MGDGARPRAALYSGLRAGPLLLMVWLSIGAHSETLQTTLLVELGSQAEASLSRGDYTGAERAARELVQNLERERSSDARSLARARDLLIEAWLGGGHAADTQTLELAQTNLEAAERLNGSNDVEVAISLHALGEVRFQRGEYASALALHEAGLDLRMRRMLPDDADLADSRERLAATQMRMERYDAARKNLDLAYAIRVKRAAEEPLKLAATQELVAWLHRYSGDYPSARAPLEAALATRRLAPGHPAIVTTLELQGDLALLEGDIASSTPPWQEALALAERTLGKQHPLVSALERRLAYSADALGNREEARQRLERALTIAEQTRAECDPELIGLIDYSANSLVADGEFVEARRRFSRSLGLAERCFGSGNSNTATVVFNLAGLNAQMGDFAEAERLYKRAIQDWSSLGSDHPYVARGLDALAEVYETNGALTRARSLYERALTIRRKIRPDHPDVAWTLTNLARVIAASGNISLALRYLSEATDIYKRNGTSSEPDHLARTITLNGDLEARRGNNTMARADFIEALALRERLFGSEHPLTAESRLKVATADFALGQYDAALAEARRAQEDGLDHVKFTVRYLPERRALAYAARTAQGLGLELSLATTSASTPPSRVFDDVIRSRSVVLDELGARVHVPGDLPPDMAAMQARLNAARQRFANLMLRSMSAATSSVDTSDILSSAKREREEAEQALADESAMFRSQLARADVGFAQVKSALPPGSVLVSFVRYDRTMMSEALPESRARRSPGSTRTARTVPSYVAFVLRFGDEEPSIVPLGAAAGIDALITEWRFRLIADVTRKDLAGSGPFLRVMGTQLRRRVWDPVVPLVDGMSRVFVIPDGALNLLPIAALPTEAGGYIVEQHPVLHYLSAERDFVRSEEAPPARSGLLAIGGPAFADASSFAALSRSPASAAGTLRTSAPGDPHERPLRGAAPGCPSLGSITFGALPASKVEAQVIARLWDQIEVDTSSGPDRARLLTGVLASERAFKELSSKRRILHLATHGFFLGGECGVSVEATRAVGGLSVAQRPARPVASPSRLAEATENPLLLSGLALAGANRRAAAGLDEEDGILTAEEVAALNLDGVEWAVLSACDTGLGTIAAGEGVMGLRRAFQIAGAHTVIMSLWSVEDGATRQWMEALYRARLERHLDTADSVREASLAMLRDRRARGLSTHPFYWAGFVAAGDWR